MAPSQPVRDAVTGLVNDLKAAVKAWNDLQEKDLKIFNAKLAKASLPVLPTGVL